MGGNGGAWVDSRARRTDAPARATAPPSLITMANINVFKAMVLPSDYKMIPH